MSGFNKAIICGRLGRDPEVRTLQSGSRIANFSLATSEQWRDKSSGERKEKTEWHNISVWNDGLIGIIEKYVRKGDMVLVEGGLETRKWTDNSGAERYSTEIVLRPYNGELTLLGGGRGSGNGYDSGEHRRPSSPAPARDSAAAAPPRGGNDDLDDEIPF
jgi:single-strand DNA-binding protein